MRTQFAEKLRQMYGNKLQHNLSKDEFQLPSGEVLRLAHAQYERDYYNFHGQQYQFVGFDELTSWKDLTLYNKLKSLCRSANPNIRTRVRSTTNSLGPGHSAVKEYFKIDSQPAGSLFKDERGASRMHLWGSIHENKHIEHDKNYLLYLASQKNPNIIKSWILGRWDILGGGALSDVWRPEFQVLKPFKIPPSWKIYRTCDWGSARPYCFHHIAVSDGSPFKAFSGKETPSNKGDCFVINEVYGYGGEANVGTRETPKAAAARVQLAEKNIQKKLNVQKILPGSADPSIYTVTGERPISELLFPLQFVPAKRSSESRITGLEVFREYLDGACPDKYNKREYKGLFFFSGLTHTLRTLPALPRDESNPEDADTDAEDHAYDSIRYFLKDRVGTVKLLFPR